MEWLLLMIYSVLLLGVGLAGGKISQWLVLTHERLQMMISFVAGLMLGIGLLRLLPHAAVMLPNFDHATGWMTIGLIVMFVFLRMFHFHQHSLAEAPTTIAYSEEETALNAMTQSGVASTTMKPDCAGHGSCGGMGTCGGKKDCHTAQEVSGEGHTHEHDHDHDHSHDHDHDHDHAQPAKPASYHPHHHHQGCDHDARTAQGSWTAILLGLTLHTMMDGFALGASYQAAFSTQMAGIWGLGTFLAVLLHKPLDTMTLGALMSHDGISPNIRRSVILFFSLVCPASMFLVVTGLSQLGSVETYFLGASLAASAGIFLCIALSDLLPEIEFHSHDRIKLTCLMISGVLVAYLIGWLEPAHQHRPKPPIENGKGTTSFQSEPEQILSGMQLQPLHFSS